MGGLHRAGRGALRVRRQRGRVSGARGRRDVRPLRSDGGDVAPVPTHRADPGDRGMEPGVGAQAPPAPRRGHLLVPAPGEVRAQPRPLRAKLPGPLGRLQRSDARGLLLPALPRRSRSARVVRRGRGGPGAPARPGRGEPGHQRPDPLHPGRQPAHRADAGGSGRVRGVRLHLRDRAGGGRRQGARGVGGRRRNRVGHVELRSAPLHGLRRPGPRPREGRRGLRPRVRDALPAPRVAGRARQAALAGARPHPGPRRPVRSLRRLGTRKLVCAHGRRHLRSRHADLDSGGSLVPPRPRGVPCRARCGRHPRPPGVQPVPRRGAGDRGLAPLPRHRRAPPGRAGRPRLLRGRPRTHRDRDVGDEARRRRDAATPPRPRSGTTGTGSSETSPPARPSRSRTGPKPRPARSSPARVRATSFAR